MSKKMVFISYSHADKEIAQNLASALNAQGVDLWWDNWEIQPGDSLVAKIFESGLSRASHFLILLSPESVRSRWVREELDVATIRRIEDLVRVIPVLIGDTEIPTSLRALQWVDLRTKFDEGVQRIVNVVHEISTKPSRPPASMIADVEPISGLSKAATAIGNLLLETADSEVSGKEAFLNSDLQDHFMIDPLALNDAVDELEDGGLIRVLRTLGKHFHQIEPTYVLFREFAARLDYDPTQDVHEVAAAVVAKSQIRGDELRETTRLPSSRINRAVAYLDDYGLVQVVRTLGTSPFTFSWVKATYRTRRFVEQAG